MSHLHIRVTDEGVQVENSEPGLENVAGLRRELAALLNKHGRENGSNTPDHILANFLIASLAAFDTAVASREDWYGIKSTPGGSRLLVSPAEVQSEQPEKFVPPECG